MPRYIDADATVKTFNEKWLQNDGSYADGIDICIREIQKQPTAFVAEVRHGKWETRDDGNLAFSDDEIQCSECGNIWNVIDNCTETFDYCPHCGAKMDL